MCHNEPTPGNVAGKSGMVHIVQAYLPLDTCAQKPSYPVENLSVVPPRSTTTVGSFRRF